MIQYRIQSYQHTLVSTSVESAVNKKLQLFFLSVDYQYNFIWEWSTIQNITVNKLDYKQSRSKPYKEFLSDLSFFKGYQLILAFWDINLIYIIDFYLTYQLHRDLSLQLILQYFAEKGLVYILQASLLVDDET